MDMTPSYANKELSSSNEISPLTGLLNRAWLDNNLPNMLIEKPESVALIFIDLENLKAVNEKQL